MYGEISVEYKHNHVGMQRHPELYNREKSSFIPDVDTELRMWQTAEILDELITEEDFDWRQMMAIIHYVLELQGNSNEQMHMLHSWAQYKICQSEMKQTSLEVHGNSARQLVTALEQSEESSKELKKLLEEESTGE